MRFPGGRPQSGASDEKAQQVENKGCADVLFKAKATHLGNETRHKFGMISSGCCCERKRIS
jgi:hypothetical protein